MTLFTKQKQTYRYQKQTYGYQRGNMAGRDKSGVWDEHTHTHTTIYKTDNQQGPTVQHRELDSIFCDNLYENLKKNEIMPFAATWMDLEIIILSEVKSDKDKYHTISLICGI